jgi:regulator of sirC expression with transglutaminase-like and TPR domain
MSSLFEVSSKEASMQLLLPLFLSKWRFEGEVKRLFVGISLSVGN